MPEADTGFNLIEMTAELVSAYVRNNSVPAAELGQLIQATHGSLATMVLGGRPEPVREALQPKVSVKKSVTAEYIVCLEDGKHFKSLKRHLHAEHDLSPEEYRSKWNLARDYPMVAPAYADARSALAKSLGLGRKTRSTPAPAASTPAAPFEPPPRKPRRRSGAAPA